MKHILIPTYDIYLEDWDIDCINKIAQTFGWVSKSIYLQL